MYKTLYAESLLSGAAPPRHAAGPVQHALADAVDIALKSAMCGIGSCSALLALSDMEALPPVARVAVGVAGSALALRVAGEMLGTTIGEIGAAWQVEFERRSAELPELPVVTTPQAPRVVRVEHVAKTALGNVQRFDVYDLPGTERQLKDFADYALSGRVISEAEVCAACPSIGGTYWDKLKEALLARGHLRWKNVKVHQQGVELTRGGKALCESLLLSPTPRAGSW